MDYIMSYDFIAVIGSASIPAEKQVSPDPPSQFIILEAISNWGCWLAFGPRLLHCVTICIHHRISYMHCYSHRYACSNHSKTLFPML